MNTYQIIAFVNHLKKQKNISNGKGKMVSNVTIGGDSSIDSVDNNYNKSKGHGDKRIKINNG